jgi:hypothetical protein
VGDGHPGHRVVPMDRYPDPFWTVLKSTIPAKAVSSSLERLVLSDLRTFTKVFVPQLFKMNFSPTRLVYTLSGIFLQAH